MFIFTYSTQILRRMCHFFKKMSETYSALSAMSLYLLLVGVPFNSVFVSTAWPLRFYLLREGLAILKVGQVEFSSILYAARLLPSARSVLPF